MVLLHADKVMYCTNFPLSPLDSDPPVRSCGGAFVGTDQSESGAGEGKGGGGEHTQSGDRLTQDKGIQPSQDDSRDQQVTDTIE